MNIEITDLDMILNYLETTSLEPHDEYTSEFTYKDQKILYKYIKELQQENEKLKNNWNELKEYAKDNLYFYSGYQGEDLEIDVAIQCVLDKMQELEGKSE